MVWLIFLSAFLQSVWMELYLVITYTVDMVPALIVGSSNWRYENMCNFFANGTQLEHFHTCIANTM